MHPIDRDAAAIELVDSDLHREHILPSEKAFAYKLKIVSAQYAPTVVGGEGEQTFSERQTDMKKRDRRQRALKGEKSFSSSKSWVQ